MQYTKFSWLAILTILAIIELFKFFVTPNPLIVGCVLIALLIVFRIKLLLGYPLLAVFLGLVYVFLNMNLILWAYILYYLIEGLLWWGLLYAIKDKLQGMR